MRSAEALNGMEASLPRSPTFRPKKDPIAFQTPTKRSRTEYTLESDEISTAAPSPWAGAPDSPWCSPEPGGHSFIFDPIPGLETIPVGMSISSDGAELPAARFAAADAAPADSMPLVTPRQAAPVQATPPATPRQAIRSNDQTTPPAQPHVKEVCLLKQALFLNSVQRVREALIVDPHCARLPFFNHRVQPPLCCAVENKCSAQIVRLLLDNAAEPDMEDLQGRTCKDILRAIRASHADYVIYEDIGEIEQMLGASPERKPTPVSEVDFFMDQGFLGEFNQDTWFRDVFGQQAWANGGDMGFPMALPQGLVAA